MTKGIDKKEFWENKILKWELARYSGRKGALPWLERIVGVGGGSVRARQEMAAKMIRPHLKGKTICDLGCGSGLLFTLLKDTEAEGFVGVDLARNAVDNARKIALENGYAEKATFLCGSFSTLDLPPFDIVVALGLVDWLTPGETEGLFSLLKGKQFLVSIAERRKSPQQLLHRAYVHVAYGRKTGSYVPAYVDCDTVLAELQKIAVGDVKIVRDKRLSFGAFLHNLPE